jgi:hypothetical protein
VVLGAEDEGAVCLAYGAYGRRHRGRFARCGALERRVWRGVEKFGGANSKFGA